VQGLQKAVTPPQPSDWGPHVVDGKLAHVSGTQAPASGKPHWSGTPPPPQIAGGVHGLQSAVCPPHPSLCSPQVVEGKFAHVSGVHAPPSGDSQWLCTQLCPAGQVAHVSSVPQPLSV
jgi:hypothetical protein